MTNNLIADKRDQMKVMASMAENEINGMVDGKISLVESIASWTRLRSGFKEYLRSPNPEEQKTLKNILSDVLRAVKDIEDIFITDLQGKIILATDSSLEGRSLPDKKIKDAGKTGPYVSVGTDLGGQKRLFIYAPMMSDDDLLGVLVINVQLSVFDQIAQQRKFLGSTGEILIAKRNADGDAEFITRRRFEGEAKARDTITKSEWNVPVTKALLGQEDVFAGLVDYRGKKVMAATRYIESLDMGLVVKFDEDEIYATLRRVKNIALIFGIAIFVFSVAFAAVAARSISRPIERLISYAQNVAAGGSGRKMDHELLLRGDELGVLALALEEMGGSLIESNQMLEIKVRERTAELEKANQVLQDSEGRYRDLFDSIDEGFCVVEMIYSKDEQPVDHRFVRANPAFERQTGLKDVQGKRARELMPNLESHWSARFGDVALTGIPIRFENYAEPLKRWFSVYAFRQGKPEERRVAIIFTNITERKKADERIRLIIEAAPNGMILVDREGTIVFVNSQLEKLFGYTREELIGQKVELLIPKRYQANHPGHRSNFFADPKIRSMGAGRDLYGLCKDGTETPIEIGLSPIETSDEMFVLASIIDITERKKNEVQILREKSLELERSNQDLERFAYVASHDLQEPLRMVASYTQLLAKKYQDKLDKSGQEYIEFAVDGARRMQQMIESLLKYSLVQKQMQHHEDVVFGDIVEAVLANLKMAIEAKKTQITIDPLPTLQADKAQMIHLVQNLISNALKFVKKDSVMIHLSAKEDKESWIFSVSDDGIGIDAQYLEKIFVLFTRLHSRSQYAGAGIGLATCKRIVEQHGGRMWVESVLGKGSTFYFALPKAMQTSGR